MLTLISTLTKLDCYNLSRHRCDAFNLEKRHEMSSRPGKFKLETQATTTSQPLLWTSCHINHCLVRLLHHSDGSSAFGFSFWPFRRVPNCPASLYQLRTRRPILVWLSYFRPQPNTSRAYLQRQVLRPYSLRPVDMHTHVRIYFLCRHSHLHRRRPHR